MRALLIVDATAEGGPTGLVLRAEGHVIDVAETAEYGAELALAYDYDVILIDGSPADMGPVETLRHLRVSGVAAPAIAIAGTGVAERVALLSAGADDCLASPCHRDELLARLTAVVRRSHGHAQSVVTVGDLSVYLDRRSAEVNGVRVALTGMEYRMLELLALRKGTTLTKEMFLNHLYDGMDEPDLKIVDVFVCKLRKKLAAAGGGGNYVETVWGRGYLLREPVAA